MEDKLIEKTTRQSLSFVEQLQNQIQLCREALSNPFIPLTPRVEAFESLLWAKLKDDKEYIATAEKLTLWFKKKKEEIIGNKTMPEWRIRKIISPYSRSFSKDKFKAIMVFIDKRGYMPIGDD